MLQQPYNSRHSANTSPTSPTTARSSFSTGPKPLAVNNIKRNPGDEYPISPASAYGNYVNSPALSEPFSPTNNTGHPATLPRVPGVHPPHSHEYNRSHSFSSSYAGWQYPQRLHMPPSESGVKTEQTMNPLHRPTASYPGLAGTIPEGAYDRHSSQASSVDHGTTTQTNSPLPPAMAYQGKFFYATGLLCILLMLMINSRTTLAYKRTLSTIYRVCLQHTRWLPPRSFAADGPASPTSRISSLAIYAII